MQVGTQTSSNVNVNAAKEQAEINTLNQQEVEQEQSVTQSTADTVNISQEAMQAAASDDLGKLHHGGGGVHVPDKK